MTVIYIDLLFFLNLIANYLLLLGTGRMTGNVLNRWKIVGGAALGALYAVAVFLPGFLWLSALPCKIIFGILMVLVAYGSEPGLLRVTILFFMASAALAGIVLAVELFGGTVLTVKNGVFYSQIDIRLMLLLFVLCYFILSLFFRRLGRHTGRDLAELEITLWGRHLQLKALKDSGHTLTDPVTNKTVVITDGKFLTAILPDEIDIEQPIETIKRCRELGIKGVRLISYRAVGVDCGMLLALRADDVTVDGKDLGSLLIALSPNPVDDGGGYQALIGGR